MPIDRDRDPRPLALTKRLHHLRGNFQPPHGLRRLDVGSELHDLPPLGSMLTHKTDEPHLKGQMAIHVQWARSRPCSPPYGHSGRDRREHAIKLLNTRTERECCGDGGCSVARAEISTPGIEIRRLGSGLLVSMVDD